METTNKKPELSYLEFDFFEFTDKTKYDYFKGGFSIQDDNHRNNLVINIYLNYGALEPCEFYQPIVRTLNGNGYKYNYIKDYLNPIIINSTKNYFNKVRLDSLDLYSKEQKFYFLEKKIALLQNLLDEYESLKFFNSKLEIDAIKKGVLKILELILKFKEEIDMNFYSKINFDTKQKNVLLLFKALYDLNVITGININDLMIFVQNHFTYDGKIIPNAKDQLRNELGKLKMKHYNPSELLALIKTIIKE